MALILVTGASTGLGSATARALVQRGHDVVLHARDAARVEDAELLHQAHAVVTADLAHVDATARLAEQVNRLGQLDAVIHNAGVLHGPEVLAVNVMAPFVLCALLEAPRRSIFLSSSMHQSGSGRLDAVDLAGPAGRSSYSDSKLFVTTLAMALARLDPAAAAHAVDPGWVPTRMGGPGAPDDLEQGHQTQQWLATAAETEIRPRTGGYWYHRRTKEPHPATRDERFQDNLLERLGAATGLALG